MAASSQMPSGNGSRRRVPRFRMQEPLYVIVSRSGGSDRVPGRAVNVCERGISAVLAGELRPGESVGVEVRLSGKTEPLVAQATVKYQDRLRCGLEFSGISAEQRLAIRGWAKDVKAELVASAVVIVRNKETAEEPASRKSGGGGPRSLRRRIRSRWLVAGVVVMALVAAFFSWRWHRGWAELESGLKGAETYSAATPQAQVPAEVMEKLLLHRVEPVYPPEARKENLQGVIAVDIIVSRDGSVIGMRPLNGPEVLARAAMEALRWWKFEPYRLDGEPVVVETTVAVEFKG